jgi:NADH:ubiquinone oxidoreductase subunit 2 (subunit N)
MNAPFVFLFLPFLAAVLTYSFFPRHPRLTIVLSAGLSALLAGAAAVIPLGASLKIFGASLPVSNTLSFLGRSFIFNPVFRPAMIFLYLSIAGMVAGSLAASPNRHFLPVLWMVQGLLTASLFIQPFLYASFFLFLCVIFLSLLLSDVSHPSPRGAARWIAYSVLGTLFLLLAGSGLSLYSGTPMDPSKSQSILLELCLGFGLLLSLPPFHFWLPDVVDDSPPYSVSVILSLFIGGVLFLMMRFMDGFSWLRQSPDVPVVFLLAGNGMCLVGSSLALFQSRLGRCVGYLSLSNLGVILVGLSIAGSVGVETTLVLLAARGFSLLIWGISFHALRPKQASDHISDLRGRAFSNPVAFSAALLSGLSLVGIPGLFSFPPVWAVLRSLSSSGPAAPQAAFSQLAVIFSMAAGVLSLYRFARPMMQVPLAFAISRGGSRLFRAVLFVSLFFFLFLGVFPQILVPMVSRVASAFPNLVSP